MGENMKEEQYFDWKGNKIEVGMTIYFVNTQHRFGRAGIFFPDGEGGYKTMFETDEELNERLSKPVWELGMPYEVEIINNEYYIKCNISEYSFSRPFKYTFQQEGVIAIKGISDENPNK